MKKKKEYEYIYTIGCFDWFHYAHENLLKTLKNMGEKLIIGIHDDSSIEKLKKIKPNEHQSLKKRMENIKKYGDIIYVIPDKDPSFFLECVISKFNNKKNTCFVRGDDMINFPGKKIIENKISIIYLPYDLGISSTEIRKKKNKLLNI